MWTTVIEWTRTVAGALLGVFVVPGLREVRRTDSSHGNKTPNKRIRAAAV